MKKGTCTLRNSIVAENIDSAGGDYPDIRKAGGGIVSGGYNIIGNRGSQGFAGTTGDVIGTAGSVVDVKLGPLTDNGGATLTRMPESSSPAFNAIPPENSFNGAPVTDQRGYKRNENYDIGACEAPVPWLLFIAH